MAPVDVTGPGTAEPVKVTHDGPGTHGSGGGGSGGGQLGQENGADDVPSKTRESDVVDGKPRDTLYAVTSAALGRQPSARHDDPLSFLRTDSSSSHQGATATGNAGAPTTGDMGKVNGPGGSGGGEYHGNGQGGKGGKGGEATGSSDGEALNRKPSGPNEAFHDWEREEMEELLGEIRGHLGE